MEQKTKGGKREGAGRKPLSYTTETVRIPSPIVAKVKTMAAKFKAKKAKQFSK